MILLHESTAGILLCKLESDDSKDVKIIGKYAFEKNTEALEVFKDIKKIIN